jgi:DUF438 domain-containing protein
MRDREDRQNLPETGIDAPTAGVDANEIKERIKEVFREVRTAHDARATPLQHMKIKQLLSRATPAMIAQAEQELVGEGFSQQDLSSACDVHLELFREATEEHAFDLPPDHPIAQFERDHRVIMQALADLRAAVAAARDKENADEAEADFAGIRKAVELLHRAENHNIRQENTLFPVLERHGIEQPPAIMWAEHTDMRNDKKVISSILSGELDLQTKLNRLDSAAVSFTEKFANHTQKEMRILYPASLQLFSEEEWREIKEECDNLGYFTDTIGAK